MVESGTGDLCGAPNPRTRYSLSNLNHLGVRGFEHIQLEDTKSEGYASI